MTSRGGGSHRSHSRSANEDPETRGGVLVLTPTRPLQALWAVARARALRTPPGARRPSRMVRYPIASRANAMARPSGSHSWTRAYLWDPALGDERQRIWCVDGDRG